MTTVHESARDIPVAYDCALCVIGGSCTGVFAAVAAARLGARVALVERGGLLGGTATASLVNIWHSTLDLPGRRTIIAGLTAEVVDRLNTRQAVIDKGGTNPNCHYVFNSAELAIELDTLIAEAKVRLFLHAAFAAPVMTDKKSLSGCAGTRSLGPARHGALLGPRARRPDELGRDPPCGRRRKASRNHHQEARDDRRQGPP